MNAPKSVTPVLVSYFVNFLLLPGTTVFAIGENFGCHALRAALANAESEFPRYGHTPLANTTKLYSNLRPMRVQGRE